MFLQSGVAIKIPFLLMWLYIYPVDLPNICYDIYNDKKNAIDTISRLLTCVFYISEEAAVDEFFIQNLELNVHSFLDFCQHGSGSSVKIIMPLPATLSLAIGLKKNWFLIALLLYPKSAILGVSFLNPRDLCLPK